MSWRHLRVLLDYLPHGSALAAEIHGPSAAYGVTEHLLLLLANVLQGANWQRIGDKHAARPKPFEAPVSWRSKPKQLAGRALDEALLAQQRRHAKKRKG